MNRQPMTAAEARAVAQTLQNFSVPQTRSQQPREYSRPATRQLKENCRDEKRETKGKVVKLPWMKDDFS